MIKRLLQSELTVRVDEAPAVALLGPRQVGKTTLALELGATRPSLYLDLESEPDRAKLLDPNLYLDGHEDKLVILDEVHRLPGLFQQLRGLIDRGRRKGLRTGRFLLLGSASIDLMAQSSETLAGRISFLELHPLDVVEVGVEKSRSLWVRGGFPESFLARSDRDSMRWRQNFIKTYLERDIPMFGPRLAAETMRRLWTMLAHLQGELFNASEIGRSLGVDSKTVTSYVDLLLDLLLVRRLEPWHNNSAKRLVKSPRLYIRDTGLVHTLLNLVSEEAVLGHPIAGASWEGFVIENLVAAAPDFTLPNFYRSSAGAEVDLLLTVPGDGLWAVEIKRSLSPKVERGFHHACADLNPARKFVVYPGREVFPLGDGIVASPLEALAEQLLALH